MTSGKWFRENVCRSKSPCISFTIAFNISGRWDGSIFLRSISSCSSMWTLSVLMIFNCKAIDSRGSRYDGAKLSCKWWNCSVPAVYRLWDRIIQLRGALARCTWEFALLCYRSVVQFHLIILALYNSATFLVIANSKAIALSLVIAVYVKLALLIEIYGDGIEISRSEVFRLTHNSQNSVV